LAVNYIPSKFSKTLLNPLGSSTRKRKTAYDALDPTVLKQGVGTDAFKNGESRIGGLQDEDDVHLLDGKTKPAGRLRWNRFKCPHPKLVPLSGLALRVLHLDNDRSNQSLFVCI